ncbi:MAG: hypothetical protein O2856_05980 [Planctomycetota bacterium]|nr:hypothetical protein [Planctomycetota bacterium]
MPANQDPIPKITRFCLAIQREWSPRERLRRLRCDEKPVVACADNRHVEVSADDWVAHHERHGGMEGHPPLATAILFSNALFFRNFQGVVRWLTTLR